MPDLPEPWWTGLRAALDTLSAVTCDRVAVREEYIRRAVPEFTGCAIEAPIEWSTAHGDFHWANLGVRPCAVLDWEGWAPRRSASTPPCCTSTPCARRGLPHGSARPLPTSSTRLPHAWRN